MACDVKQGTVCGPAVMETARTVTSSKNADRYVLMNSLQAAVMTWAHYSSSPGCHQTRRDLLLCCGRNVRVSQGRCGCSCIHSLRCFTASLARSSFRPNSRLTLNSNSSLGGSVTSSEIPYVVTKVCSSQYHVTVHTGLLSKTVHYHRISSVHFQGQIIQVCIPNSKSLLR